MEDISDEDYTYNAGVPWPERAEKRLALLEAQYATLTTAHNSLAQAHSKLAGDVRVLNVIVHRLLNAGEAAEDDGK